MITADLIKESKTYKKVSNKISQLDYYRSNNASEEILKIVGMESKAFGSIMEKLIIEHFSLCKRKNTQHDACFGDKKIEIKSARYWAGQDNCKWQHIELKHDYEFIIFSLVDFDHVKTWIANKSMIRDHITPQGLQGYWTDKNTIMPYIIEFNSREELEFILNNV